MTTKSYEGPIVTPAATKDEAVTAPTHQGIPQSILNGGQLIFPGSPGNPVGGTESQIVGHNDIVNQQTSDANMAKVAAPPPPQYTYETIHNPGTLSYQAAVGQAMRPVVSALGALGGQSNINSALSGLPYASQANAAIPGISNTIASTLQSSIQDYQQGLNSMLKYAGTATPLQDILKGMGELLAYPTSTVLTGTNGAPGGVQEDPLLAAIYNIASSIRGGGSIPVANTQTNGSSYNSSPLATATGG